MFKEQQAAGQAVPRASRTMRSLIGLLFFACSMFHLVPTHASAQTMISGTQIRNPLTPVVVLPSTCILYSVYFLTTTQTPYICSTINTLTLLAGQSGSLGLPTITGSAGYLYTDGAHLLWGDVIAGGSGALDCQTTPGQCDIVTPLVPLLTSANTWKGANDFSGASLTKPFMSAPAAPSSPQEGQTYYDTSEHTPYYYNGTTFTSFGGGGGSAGATIYDQPGTTALSNPKIWAFYLTWTGYPVVPVNVPSTVGFTSTPVCTVTPAGALAQGEPAGYCTVTNGAGCSSASTATTLYFKGDPSSGATNSNISSVMCVGN